MWTWMRQRRKPWTCVDLADAVQASERQTRRYVARLAAAGYLRSEGEHGGDGGQIPARLWRLARDTGPIAPVLVGGATGTEVADLNSNMTGAQLHAIRRAAGLSAAAFARAALGVVDQRTVWRYERLATVPAPVAERAQRYAREHRLR